MIRAYLEHQLERAKRDELTGIRHCHVKGLHSVMLHDQPGNRIRMFFATDDHLLFWDAVDGGLAPLPLAIHSHHCDVKLVGIFGGAKSLTFRLGGHGFLFTKCRFESAITGKDGKLISRSALRTLELVHTHELHTASDSLYLDADDLHTVTVPKGEQAAWLVIEGAEDPDYHSVCYTNKTSWDTFGLYESAYSSEIQKWLARAIARGAEEYAGLAPASP